MVWMGWASFGVIVALALLLGACQAIEMPLRQAMFSDLVNDPRDLPNAIALMAFMNNAGRLIGPTVAGFVIGLAGENVCFAINGFGYLFVIIALVSIRWPQVVRVAARTRVLADLREGVVYAWRWLPIRATLGLLATVGFCYLPYLVIMPIYTHEVLHADARTLGFLLSAAGLGAVGGLVWIASAANADTVPRMLAMGGTIGGIGMLALSACSWFAPALIGMAAVGLGVVVTATASNVYLQAVAAGEQAWPSAGPLRDVLSRRRAVRQPRGGRAGRASGQPPIAAGSWSDRPRVHCVLSAATCAHSRPGARAAVSASVRRGAASAFEHHEQIAFVDGLAGGGADLRDAASAWRYDGDLHLHRFQQDQRVVLRHLAADLHYNLAHDAGQVGFDFDRGHQRLQKMITLWNT